MLLFICMSLVLLLSQVIQPFLVMLLLAFIAQSFVDVTLKNVVNYSAQMVVLWSHVKCYLWPQHVSVVVLF